MTNQPIRQAAYAAWAAHQAAAQAYDASLTAGAPSDVLDCLAGARDAAQRQALSLYRQALVAEGGWADLAPISPISC